MRFLERNSEIGVAREIEGCVLRIEPFSFEFCTEKSQFLKALHNLPQTFGSRLWTVGPLYIQFLSWKILLRGQ